jgi:predicted nucleic acid-binding protein
VAVELFVDTSGWFPLVDPDDRAHAAVARALREAIKARRRVVTTNLVVAETHALIMRRIHRAAAMGFLREVTRAPNIIVSSSPALETAATSDWLDQFEDQDFSLTDAVSFAVMKQRGIRDALAVDHHFAIAGFAVIPDVRGQGHSE